MTISTQHKGKRGELIVFGELMRRDAELYTPLVDIGVDAVVRGQSGTYMELQVKATEAPDQDRYFNFNWEPQPGRFFICVSLKDDPPSVWVLPWDVFKEFALKAGEIWRLPLPEKRGRDCKSREEMLEAYKDSEHRNVWRPLLPP